MPEVDFTDVPDAEDGNFEPMPPGKYHAQVVDVESKNDRNGNEYFNVKYKIIDGEFAGRFVWDGVFFSEKSLGRLKLIASRLLGIKPLGKTMITTDMFTDKTCWLELIQEDYTDKSGNSKRKNSVPFGGYLSDKEENDTPGTTDKDLLPF